MLNRPEHPLAGGRSRSCSEKITQGETWRIQSRNRARSILGFVKQLAAQRIVGNAAKSGCVPSLPASRALRACCGEWVAVWREFSDLQLCCGKQGLAGAMSLHCFSGYIPQPSRWPAAEQGCVRLWPCAVFNFSIKCSLGKNSLDGSHCKDCLLFQHSWNKCLRVSS